jgi:hypothetical protein
VTPDNDRDGDGVLDSIDVCADDWDPCTVDSDGDGVPDPCDSCELIPNPGAAQHLRPLGFRIAPGILAVELLRAERRGVSLVTEDMAGRQELVGYETERLWPATDRDVGGCF